MHIQIVCFLCLLIVFKYFRLWGDHGQSALESACVCLVNVSAVGTEILKNMILPGSNFNFFVFCLVLIAQKSLIT